MSATSSLMEGDTLVTAQRNHSPNQETKRQQQGSSQLPPVSTTTMTVEFLNGHAAQHRVSEIWEEGKEDLKQSSVASGVEAGAELSRGWENVPQSLGSLASLQKDNYGALPKDNYGALPKDNYGALPKDNYGALPACHAVAIGKFGLDVEPPTAVETSAPNAADVPNAAEVQNALAVANPVERQNGLETPNGLDSRMPTVETVVTHLLLRESTASGDLSSGKRKRKRPARFENVELADLEDELEILEEAVKADVPLDEPVKKQNRRVSNGKAKAVDKAVRSGSLDNLERVDDEAASRLQQILNLLAANTEPFYNNEWRQKPWPARPYESIPHYQVAKDAGEHADSAALQSKLTVAPSAPPAPVEALHDPGSRNQAGEGPGTTASASPIGVDSAALRQEVARQLAAHSRSLKLNKLPPPLRLGLDVEERPAWGLDCYTHRAIAGALSTCKELKESTSGEDLEEACNAFIRDHLLPAINRQREGGWNICLALKELLQRSTSHRETAIAAHALWAVQAIEDHHNCSTESDRQNGGATKPHDFQYWRIHPKGQGIFAVRDIPEGSFVSEYLGELYAPWRWFEKQDLLRKRSRKGDLPDFYNICLERPADVDGGADVVFVEAADRGNFASRLSHSCGPNCRNLAVIEGGSRITNALFTTRNVAAGEELCWDYACVTESEQEFRAAICLCATPSCRGSFLYYANSSTFQEVMQRRHGFLDRNAMLVRACSEPLTQTDRDRLRTYGIASSLLGSDPLPWVEKWASLVLHYIEVERRLLPDLLRSAGRFSDDSVDLEADGVKENRLQNLAITLNKIAFFLRHQPPAQSTIPPLTVLSESDVLKFLWEGRESVWSRATSAALSHLKGSKAASTASIPPVEAAAKIRELIEGAEPETAQHAKQKLLQLSAILRQCSPASTALADVLVVLAATETFFTPAKFAPVRSAVSEPNPADDSPAEGCKPEKKKRGAKLQLSKEDSKLYGPAYLWGQCVVWFKQTIFDPTASLSADRRGTLSLPDLDSIYKGGDSKGSYNGKQRQALLKLMARQPSSKWPTTLPFSFKNNAKVYGSVMLDAALRAAEDGGSESLATTDAKFAAVLQELAGARP